ncbi:unnamed protein product [Cunninghamella echinulata]
MTIAHLDTSKITKINDLRSAATRQSSLFPRTNTGDYKIRFNMIQFYIYYMIGVATWPPLSIPSQPSSILNSKNTTLNYNSNNNSLYSSISAYSIPPSLSSTSSLNTSTSTKVNYVSTSSSTITTTTINATQNDPNLPYLIPGRLRSIQASIYGTLIQEYLLEFIPCVMIESAPYHPVIGTFFLDALIEIWIRTSWLASSQKLSIEYIQSLYRFIKYIVSGDLRRCISYKHNNDDTTKLTEYTKIYHLIKDEYYLLLSRLSVNWRKQDDYIWVLDLWKLWAAPWRLGNDTIITSTTNICDVLEMKSIPAPLEEGWTFFILDNAWYYLTLMDQFLQKTATFTYPDKPTINTNPLGSNTTNNNNNNNNNNNSNNSKTNNMIKPSSSVQASLDGNSIYGELGIIHQLLCVWKCKNIITYLGLIEDGLEIIAYEKPSNRLPEKNNSISSFMNHTRNKLMTLSSSLSPSSQSSKDETLETLAMISCNGDKTNILPIQQLLQSIHDRIMSVSNDHSNWKSSNIYSTQRHPRLEVLIKTIDSLNSSITSRRQQQQQQHQIRGKIGAPNWTNTMLGQSNMKYSTSTKEIELLTKTINEISDMTKIPILSDQSRSTLSITTSNISTKDNKALLSSQPTVSSKNESLIKTNKMNDDKNKADEHNISDTFKPIPAFGPRAEEMVRSYENAYLVSWVVPFERKFNKLYSRWITSWCPFIPKYISYRWLAAPINLFYLLFLFLIITAIIR